MASDRYFVRIRGRVSGPYDLEQLSKLVRSSKLSRIHEVSSDRTNWTSVSEFDALFAATSIPQPDTELDLSDGAIPIAPLDDEIPATGPVSYYYEREGTTMGPVSPDELRTLARQNQVLPQDMIWSDDNPELVAAAISDVLAPVFRSGSTSRHAPLSEMAGERVSTQHGHTAEPPSIEPIEVSAIPPAVTIERKATPMELGYAAVHAHQFPISAALTLGWRIMSNHYGALLGATLLYGVIQCGFSFVPILGTMASLILGPPIGVGFTFMAISAN